MNTNTKRILTLGVAATALGAVLSLALSGKTEVPDTTPVVNTERQPTVRERIAEINRADQIPDKQKAAKEFSDARWGPLGEPVTTLAQVGVNGERKFQFVKVVAGLKGDGEPIYGRMYSSIIPQEFKKAKNPVRTTSPRLRVEGFTPSPTWGKIKQLNRELRDAGGDPKNLPPKPESPSEPPSEPTSDSGE